jgi:hypothetical protein
VVLQYLEDVLVAADDPEVVRGSVEDGLLAARERVDGIRVLALIGARGSKWIVATAAPY